MSKFINKSKLRSNFTVLPNQIVGRADMSFKSKGLLWYLLSKPEDWEANIPDIESHTKESKDAISSAIKELEELGYLKREKVKNKNGQFDGWNYFVYDKPIRENPMSDNPPQLSTEYTNNITTNSSNTSEEVIWYPYKDRYGIYGFYRTDKAGYILLSKVNPPRIGCDDIIKEHTWVYQNEKGNVPDGHVINHINHVKTDNRIENLEVLTQSEHMSKHHSEGMVNNTNSLVNSKGKVKFTYQNQQKLIEALKLGYPKQLRGFTDPKLLRGTWLLAQPRKGKDEWMDKENPMENIRRFLNYYLNSREEQYCVGDIYKLNQELRDWRELGGNNGK